MKIVAGLKAAAKSLASPPKAQSFRAAGKQIECPHCANVLFHKKRFSLSTASSAMSNTEWTDHEACVLICANCTRLEWFYDNLDEQPGA